MSVIEKLGESVTGLLRWLAVFLVGFVIGYGLMSFAIEPPSAEELPIAIAEAPAEPAPIELPALEVPEVPTPASPEVPTPAEPVAQAPPAPEVTSLAPEVIDTESAAPEIPRPWWEACQSRRCRLDFGGISGNLTIRKASLVHGSTIDWATDMSAKPRIESLPTERPLELHVEAIAMDEAGNPTAAEIVWKKRGRAIRGVIALDLGEPGKRVVMHP